MNKHKILLVVMFAVTCVEVFAAKCTPSNAVPPQAIPVMAQLSKVIDRKWESAPMRAMFAAQIERETGLCGQSFSPTAQLKTRNKAGVVIEEGTGFGQTTITRNADGSIKMDNYKGIAALDKDLKGYSYLTRFNPDYQLTALVVYDRQNFNRIGPQKTVEDQWGFAQVCYNAGCGTLQKIRTKCRMTKGCDASQWSGNVENIALYTKATNYRLTPDQIRVAYVNYIRKQRPKYVPYMENKDAVSKAR